MLSTIERRFLKAFEEDITFKERLEYSFDMNGNEVSCISDDYEIENLAGIEDT